jgi:IclR family transcriptional regulator, pca regulon regulatory protein
VSTRLASTPVAEPSTTELNNGTPVGSLARGLGLLEAAARARRDVGVSELAQLTGIDKATTHRLVRALSDMGYLMQVPETRRYRVGLRVLDLGFAFLSRLGLRELALPYLESLASEVGGSISLAVLDGADFVFVERLDAPQFSTGVDMNVGARLPAHVSSLGKAMLACLSDDELEGRYAGRPLPAYTLKTIVDFYVLRAEIDRIREQGYALNDEETVPGFRSAAAAIRDRDGAPAGAINVAVLSSQWSLGDVEQRIAPPVVRATAAISSHLGFRPTNHRASA